MIINHSTLAQPQYLFSCKVCASTHMKLAFDTFITYDIVSNPFYLLVYLVKIAYFFTTLL